MTDGDTLKARCGEPGQYQQITVRIAAIDAPERRQPFGNASRQVLTALCLNDRATIILRTNDKYGRWVADVYCSDRDVGTTLVSSGMAWVYDRYADKTEHAALFALQTEAKAGRVGLWRDAGQVVAGDAVTHIQTYNAHASRSLLAVAFFSA